MIIQTFKHKSGDIRIENAETLEEAKKEGFPDGVFSRFFIGDKQVTTYNEVVAHIVKQARAGSVFTPPSVSELKTMQQQMIQKQKDMMIEQLEKLKKTYAGMNIPTEALAHFDKAMDAINLAGVRVSE